MERALVNAESHDRPWVYVLRGTVGNPAIPANAFVSAIYRTNATVKCSIVQPDSIVSYYARSKARVRRQS